MPTLEERIKTLENEIVNLKYQLLVIDRIISPKMPGWVQDSLSRAVSARFRPSPYGEGYDTYRIIDLIDKVGLFLEKGK
ncbi:hypothetical protein LF941_15605 [Pectobacterium versatile]|uniref:hypothetical protein n=1 Tax=Pectobacterium versatile TaxID=2488639 RepID=UPI000D611277|nr:MULTISPECIES: hypothetical protein [Pectobacterium]MBQ4793611.1 hypothetical protein [Pectobacterium versatile]MCA6916817.1 hypothetical protein [Pectobacterium versatile]MCL6397979.1 hypothetical protein [Pectobacterium carotovorum subsp. carotovorum]PWD72727.1 hypothetical protein DF215_02885 [Pectobacterium versatile]TAI82938.1 hypothetical protein EG333_17360 [Pectobacterium versatile]